MKRTSGSKYDSSLKTTEIAKRIRAELKAALPEFKFSVRAPRHSAIDIEIVEVPEGFVIPNAARIEFDLRNPYAVPTTRQMSFRTAQAEAVAAVVERIANAYNYDNSEIETDYFDVRFYLHLTFRQESAQRAAIRAELEPAAPKSLKLAERLRAVG